MFSVAPTSGIEGPDFRWAYAGLTVPVGLAVRRAVSAQLTRYALLLTPDAIKRMRRLWLLGTGPALVGGGCGG